MSTYFRPTKRIQLTHHIRRTLSLRSQFRVIVHESIRLIDNLLANDLFDQVLERDDAESSTCMTWLF